MDVNSAGVNGQTATRKAAKPAQTRRIVEAEYLAALADAVPLARWRRIVSAAADLAEKGDAKAREWLTRYLLGEEPPSLAAIAAETAEGIAVGDTALLAALLRAKADARHQALCSFGEAEVAQKILDHLARLPDEQPEEKSPSERLG